MFPQLRQRFGSALDLMIEFSTLGEYRLDADGVLCPASVLTPAPEQPQLGGAGDSVVARAAVRRIVAGGAVGLPPAATPAARRAAQPAPARRPAQPAPARRPAAAAPKRAPRVRPHVTGEQLCLAV